MPTASPACANADCGHPRAVHNSADGPEMFCRVTRCRCLQYLSPVDEPEPADHDPRRLVIEIPEGFTVTVQLVPIEGVAE